MKHRLASVLGCAALAASAWAAGTGCGSDGAPPESGVTPPAQLAAIIGPHQGPPTSPNGVPQRFELAGGDVHVTYVASPLGGGPELTYDTPTESLAFHGPEIQTEDTVLGKLVTVVVRRTVDSGSSTFTVLLPPVRVVDATTTPVETQGITTFHRFSVVPTQEAGQLDAYTFTPLTGRAVLSAVQHGQGPHIIPAQ